ncbi:Cullin-1 [Orchesella cincta]|uniref:Cullin-1 n=1 Tax=Orchesella cincta TaxID=48709 RepID=A0A1D2NI25_ORCCI|nr:Cullin-1 [Orchesella cincta]
MATAGNLLNGQQNDVESIWLELSHGIQDVYAHREMTSERFMQLYTHVYNYCTKSPSTPDGGGAGSRRSARIRRRVPGETASSAAFSSAFVGHDLYSKIREFLKNYLADLTKNGADKMGEDLLTFYLREWERFTFSSKVMNGFCSYLNRHWVRRECDEGREHVYQIYQLALDIWKENFFEPLHGPAIATVLQIINRDRLGEMVNTGAIKGLVDSLVELGTDRNAQDTPQNQNRNDDLGIYQRRFEDSFITETESFYSKESIEFLHSDKSVPEYLKKVDLRLLEERRRVGLYLHASTMDRLMRTCDTVLIEKQLAALHDEFPKLLKAERGDDMGRMYDLVARLGDAFGNMRELLQTHIATQGSMAIHEHKDQCNKEPTEYIKTILDVYNKFSGLVSTAFKQDPGFVAALDRACGTFINSNEITRDPKGAHKSPEMLARYCDSLLKKTGKNYEDKELDELLNQAMVIFKFIEDKDVFQKYYSRMLANRLVSSMSASDDAESSMIAKLKVACGFEYINKLQRMYQDIGLSKDMNEDLKQWLGRQQIADPMKVDFYIMVLSYGSWPFSPDTNDGFLLPQVLEPCVNIFSQYYQEMHTGRKLNWLYSKSKGEVVANCFGNKYTFVLSTYSIGVITQYNTKDSYKLYELSEATQLREDIVTQIVQLFMKANLLKSNHAEDKLSLQSEITLNKGYKNKRFKVNLMQPLKTEVKIEDEKTQASVEDGRLMECQAAIVRIMKARKFLEHQNLLSEVISQLNHRFKPSIPLIKKSIDILIEREYLGRKEGEHNTYEYRT